MRLRQLRIRYEQLIPGGEPRRLGDPWAQPWSWALASPEWHPPTDVYETAGGYAVKVEAAGLTEDDFEVLLYEDRLVLQGERPWRGVADAVRLHAAEIRYGPFLVALQIPSDVDRARICGRYEAGFLLITLPKQEGLR